MGGKRGWLLVAAAVVLVGCSGCWAEGDKEKKEKEEAAVTAAENWLRRVDEGRYGESWEEASELFRNAVDRQEWEKSVKAVRGPLGALKSRERQSATYATTLPGVPDGEYVVIVFKAAYANKRTAFETVTSVLEKDGKWRVSGYYLK